MNSERSLDLARALAVQYDSAALALLESSQYWASALMVCSGIDAFAGLCAGRAEYKDSARDFVSFVETYMPVFRQPAPQTTRRAVLGDAGSEELVGGRLAWANRSDRPVGSCAEVLYGGFRCGLVHQGLTSPGINVVSVDESPVFVFTVTALNGEVAYKMDLNAGPFRQEFVDAVGTYMESLTTSADLEDRFWQRWRSITDPQWVLTRS